jgi:hypothetical protein
MKATSIFVILLFSQLTTSQTYILDSTFGNNGQIQYNNSSFVPTKVISCNNNYYYFGGNRVFKTNNIGQLQNSFGVNSMLTFSGVPPNQNLHLTNLIYTNNAFYAYGSIGYDVNSIASDDIIIYKFDESGILDSTFGISGAARINLGDKESVSNIIVKTDGSIYCGGTRLNKTVYFKLTPQGVLDYNFDTNGYKTITNYPNSSSGYLIPNGNGDYLLVGLYNDLNQYGILIITKVNENGVVDTTFGNNGYKTSQLAGGIGGHTINDVQFYQNKLYVQHYHYFSPYNFGTNLKVFDLSTDQSIYDQSEGFDFDFIVKSDGIYIAQRNYCGQTCTGLFTLRKRNLNGALDTTFHNNGTYTYDFPDAPASVESILRCLHVNESGEIVLSGYTLTGPYFATVTKFASIRIIQGALGASEFDFSDLSIQPNPFNTNVSIKTQGKISNVTVYSLNGVEICKPEIMNLDGTVTIDLTPIKSSGIYILKFYSDNNQIIKKLIKY